MFMRDGSLTFLNMKLERLVCSEPVNIEQLKITSRTLQDSTKLQPIKKYCHNFRQQNPLGANTGVGNIYWPGLDNVLLPRLLQQEKEKE